MTNNINTSGQYRDRQMSILKMMTNEELSAAIRLARKVGARTATIEALRLEAFDRVLGALWT